MAQLTYNLSMKAAKAARTRNMNKARNAKAFGMAATNLADPAKVIRASVKKARAANRQIVAILRGDSVADRRTKKQDAVAPRKMTRVQQFERGGRGVFTCASCGRKTRETTSDNPEICGPCYELAGFENGVTDLGESHIADYLHDAIAYYKEITAKGGTYDFGQSPELGAAVKAALAVRS